MTRLLAIDPGYDRCGAAVIEGSSVLFSTCITTGKELSHHERLTRIYHRLQELLSTWRVQSVALETLFFSVNKKSALKVAEARGVVLLLAGMHKLPVLELSPQEVKLSMTGVGNATKEQVEKMVALSLKIDLSGKRDDEIDAIALGIAAAQKYHVDNLQKTLAKKK